MIRQIVPFLICLTLSTVGTQGFAAQENISLRMFSKICVASAPSFKKAKKLARKDFGKKIPKIAGALIGSAVVDGKLFLFSAEENAKHAQCGVSGPKGPKSKAQIDRLLMIVKSMGFEILGKTKVVKGGAMFTAAKSGKKMLFWHNSIDGDSFSVVSVK